MTSLYPVALLAGIVLLLSSAGCRSTQEQAAPSPSPYAGEESRAIKGLSPEEIEGYLSGAGMGLARVAELNSYPGPRHVLDLADALELTDAQRAQTRSAMEQMRIEAVRLGEQIVAGERALDSLFAAGEATSEAVRPLLLELGRLKAELRLAHVNAHLQMKEILSESQVQRYDRLRGYRSGSTHGMHPHDNH